MRDHNKVTEVSLTLTFNPQINVNLQYFVYFCDYYCNNHRGVPRTAASI